MHSLKTRANQSQRSMLAIVQSTMDIPRNQRKHFYHSISETNRNKCAPEELEIWIWPAFRLPRAQNHSGDTLKLIKNWSLRPKTPCVPENQ